jgi:uncharacterized glyoxalase superfamily protein PhnB
MADQTPNIFPTMRFADADAALAWLSRAFGFQEQAVHRDEGGAIRHAEMSLGAGMIMFGQGDSASQAIYVAVDDTDAHYERAKAAGAEITREIEDTPYDTREYSARDIDGHTWHFGTYLPKPSRDA